uniref:Aladin n=3 Tax=Lygus hesperus TaxID=30085 RepID=A0A0A9WTJ4_LYGHE
MCSLGRFPDLPITTDIPICQVDGKIQYASAEFPNLQLFTDSVSDHPRIALPRDALNQPRVSTSTGTVFLPGDHSLLERIEDAWFESGIGRVLDILDDESTVFKYPARYLRMFMKSIQQIIKYTIVPSYEEYTSHVHTEREKFPVVSVAWHPHFTMIAVATRDDTITIYSHNSNFNPILKSKAQRRITCIEWRPLSLGELAVACSAGVYVWDIDTENIITRPAISTSARLLPGSYVTSISWSPDGNYLATSNGYSNCVTIWSPDEMRRVGLKNIGGISQVSWSPDLTKIMVCSGSDIMRIWKTTDWTAEPWKTSGGAAVHPVWSKDGAVLLFATRIDPCLCCINFSTQIFSSASPQTNVVQSVADLARVEIGEDLIVGGEVIGMAWDPLSQYLAVIFKDSPLVAVFYTRTAPVLAVKPGFFIKGLTDEVPTTVTFQFNFGDGANLTICWSSGRVQYFPIVSSDSRSRHNLIRKGF